MCFWTSFKVSYFIKFLFLKSTLLLGSWFPDFLDQRYPNLTKTFWITNWRFDPDQNQDWILWSNLISESFFSFEQPIFKIWSNPIVEIRSDYFWTTGPRRSMYSWDKGMLIPASPHVLQASLEHAWWAFHQSAMLEKEWKCFGFERCCLRRERWCPHCH